VYQLVFPLGVVLGSVADLTSVWYLVDILNGLLAIPNLAALLLLSPEVFRQLKRWRGSAAQREQRRPRSA
jgi:AGCS family alanine or glycine:cation symporter